LSDITDSGTGAQPAEAVFRSIFERAAVGIAVVDLEHTIRDANPALCKVLGYRLDELKGMKSDVIIHPEDAASTMAAYSELLAGRTESHQAEVRFRTKDGLVRLGQVTISVVRDADLSPSSVVVTVEDITERREMEEALRESEERFRSSFDHAVSGIALVDLEDNYMRVNKAFCDMLGRSEEEVIQVGFKALTHPPDLEANMKLRRQLYAGEIPAYMMEKRYIHKDGHLVWALLSASGVRDSAGKLVHTISQVEDITARKLAEADLKRYSNKLEEMVKERTRELNESNRQLLKAERLAAIGSVAAQVGHDLRSPLTAVRTNLFYVQNTLPEKEKTKLEEVLKSMDDSLVHANGIIADLFDYSKKTKLKMEELDLGKVLRSALRQISFPAHVQLVTKPFRDAPISGDATYLVRIFQNIIFNAIDAMPKGGTLTIGMVVRKNRVLLTFADTGQGISKESMGRLFTPFFTTKPKGTGLGLAICKRLVEAHHGTISVNSKLGKGTTLALTFPLTRNPAG